MIFSRIRGADSFQTGHLRGERLRAGKPEIAEWLFSNLDILHPDRRKKALNQAGHFFNAIRRRMPDADSELKGIAEGMDWKAENLWLFNLWPYLLKEAVSGCSGFFLDSERTEEKSPVLVRNKDLPPFFEKFQEFSIVTPRNGHPYACLRNAGWIGCDQGVNRAGFGFALFSAHSGRYSPGIPAHMAGTLLLSRASALPEAIEMLIRMPGTGEAIFLLSDAAGRAAVFESGYGRRFGIRRPKGGKLIAANHYLTKPLAPLTAHLKSARRRYARLAERLKTEAPISMDGVSDILSEHHDSAAFNCLCRHDDRMKTISTSLVFPARKEMRVQVDNPCRNRGFQSFYADG